jgi:hypothetical protein
MVRFCPCLERSELVSRLISASCVQIGRFGRAWRARDYRGKIRGADIVARRYNIDMKRLSVGKETGLLNRLHRVRQVTRAYVRVLGQSTRGAARPRSVGSCATTTTRCADATRSSAGPLLRITM